MAEVPEYQVHIDWDDDGVFTGTGEDVSEHAIVDRQSVHVEYGRDQQRALAPIQPGLAALDLTNRDGDYTPGNTASPLTGLLRPGHELRIQAVYQSTTYALYRGYIDDYQLNPDVGDPRVSLSGTDAIGRLAGLKLSTALHSAVRTGAAIALVLDAIGWPTAARDIDVGATTIPWWWEEGTEAKDAINRIVQSEGPPAFATVDTDGMFIFRDRHHRLLNTASLTSQATFSGTDDPVISSGMVVDYGWHAIINSVSIPVQERQPSGLLTAVWSSNQIYAVADGETITITATASDPFVEAVAPEEDTDFQLLSGTVQVTLSRTNGISVDINVTGVGGPAVIQTLQLRAFAVAVARTLTVTVEDTVSIGQYGMRSAPQVPGWVTVYDALAIGEIILAHRASRPPPTVIFTIRNSDASRLVQQLTRDLSDRITIQASTAGLDSDFHIERIEHDFDGANHDTMFGCEEVSSQVDPVFRFDTSGQGFDDGLLGRTGLDDPDLMLLFDTSGQGFDDGMFAT